MNAMRIENSTAPSPASVFLLTEDDDAAEPPVTRAVSRVDLRADMEASRAYRVRWGLIEVGCRWRRARRAVEMLGVMY